MFHVRENRMLPPVKIRLELVTLYSGRVQLFMFDIEGSGMVTTDAREARRVEDECVYCTFHLNN